MSEPLFYAYMASLTSSGSMGLPQVGALTTVCGQHWSALALTSRCIVVTCTARWQLKVCIQLGR